MTPSILGAELGQTLLDGSPRWRSEISASRTRRSPAMLGTWLILPSLEVSGVCVRGCVGGQWNDQTHNGIGPFRLP